MKYCSRCGKPQPDNAVFCDECGMKLASYEQQNTKMVHPMAQTDDYDTAPMVLGVVGIVFALCLPLVTYACSIVGLVLANKGINEGRTTKTTARTLNIIALVIAGINSLFGAIMGAFGML